jgi:hypothetical protein
MKQAGMASGRAAKIASLLAASPLSKRARTIATFCSDTAPTLTTFHAEGHGLEAGAGVPLSRQRLIKARAMLAAGEP